MSKSKNTPQAAKVRNEGWMRAEQERRRSNVAVPHRNKKRYTRKEKYRSY
jgi:hypothetical protein